MSSITYSCFWNDDWETLELLNANRGWFISFALQLKMTSLDCLIGSGLLFIFHWKVQLSIIPKYLWKFFAAVWVSCTTENKEASSSNGSGLVVTPSVKLLL